MFLQMHVMHNEKLYIKSQSHHLLNNFSITFPVPAKSCFKLQLALTKKKKNWHRDSCSSYFMQHKIFSQNLKQNRQSAALTSPQSDSRCFWRELASLTNRFLGPTRSAKLPMMTLWWPRCTPLLYNLTQCLSSPSVFFVYLHNAFMLPLSLRHWHTYAHTHMRETHTWLALNLG